MLVRGGREPSAAEAFHESPETQVLFHQRCQELGLPERLPVTAVVLAPLTFYKQWPRKLSPSHPPRGWSDTCVPRPARRYGLRPGSRTRPGNRAWNQPDARKDTGRLRAPQTVHHSPSLLISTFATVAANASGVAV